MPPLPFEIIGDRPAAPNYPSWVQQHLDSARGVIEILTHPAADWPLLLLLLLLEDNLRPVRSDKTHPLLRQAVLNRTTPWAIRGAIEANLSNNYKSAWGFRFVQIQIRSGRGDTAAKRGKNINFWTELKPDPEPIAIQQPTNLLARLAVTGLPQRQFRSVGRHRGSQQ